MSKLSQVKVPLLSPDCAGAAGRGMSPEPSREMSGKADGEVDISSILLEKIIPSKGDKFSQSFPKVDLMQIQLDHVIRCDNNVKWLKLYNYKL